MTIEVQSSESICDCRAIPFKPLLSQIGGGSLTVEEWVRLAFDAWVGGVRPSSLYDCAIAVGRYMFDQLFVDEVNKSFNYALDFVQYDRWPQTFMRLRLLLPPSLNDLPWELLYCDKTTFLATAPKVFLTRAILEFINRYQLIVANQLNIVGLVARPPRWGIEDNVVIAHERYLSVLLRKGYSSEPKFIRGRDTENQLRQYLKDPVHILDVTCHGKVKQGDHEGVLLFEGSDEQVAEIGAESIAKRLEESDFRIRVVFLKACASAMQPGAFWSSSIGSSIARSTRYAVIAMQFLIPVTSASELTNAFYRELSESGEVDRSLQMARLSIRTKYRNTLDWAVPVLYLQTADGVLFHPNRTSILEDVEIESTVLGGDRADEGSSELRAYRFQPERQRLERIFNLAVEDTPRKRATAKEFIDYAEQLSAQILDAQAQRKSKDVIEEMRRDSVKYAKRAIDLYKHVNFYRILSKILASDQRYSEAVLYCDRGISVGANDTAILQTKLDIVRVWERFTNKQILTNNTDDEDEQEQLERRLGYFRETVNQINERLAQLGARNV